MDYQLGRPPRNMARRFLLRGICLLTVWGCSTMPLWAADGIASTATTSRPAALPTESDASLPVQTMVTDPCTISLPRTRANAAAPSPSQISALTSLMARAKSQANVSPVDSQRGSTAAQELWSSRIPGSQTRLVAFGVPSMPGGDSDAEASLALKRLILQVHSLTRSEKSVPQPPEPMRDPKRDTSRLGTLTKPAMTVQPPAPTPVDTNSVKVAPAPAVVPATPDGTSGLSPKAQKTLDDLRQNPSRVQDPLEAAELLFLSGRATDAVPFYEEALRRTRAGDAACVGDRAWILFQLGNCLRETDITKAQDAYTKLIAEYPDSPWTEMARASGRYLTWYQSTRPDQLRASAGK
jgi:tetratricopeptide (TPR) repeat protein